MKVLSGIAAAALLLLATASAFGAESKYYNLANNTVLGNNVCSELTSVPIHSFQLDPHGNPGWVTGLKFTTTGNYSAGEIVRFRLYWTTGSTFSTNNSLATIPTPTAAGTQTFPSFNYDPKSSGNSLVYFWITMDVASLVTSGHTITVSNTIASDITVGANTSVNGSATASGTHILSAPPTITSASGSTTKTVGQSATFSVTATGTSLAYQWRKNTAPLTGATSSSYTVSSVVTADAGSYDCVVTGTCGSMASQAALLTVNKATPVITWNNPADIVYRTLLSGTQLNATASVPGTFAYSPAAGTVLNAGSSQGLSVTFIPTDTANYTAATATVYINVTAVSTATTLSSSLSPALPTENVTLTATVTAAGGAAPTGTVQFKNNGNNLGSPLAISSSGQATLPVLASALSHGNNSITAVYVNTDGNFSGSTGSLNQVVNTLPVAGAFALGLGENAVTTLAASKVARSGSDADSDTLSVTAVATTSTQGGTVSLSGSTITYTPPADYTGPDTFTYTLSDSFATTTGTVSVTIGGVSLIISKLEPQPGGAMRLVASGLPGQTYSIQASGGLNGSWQTIATLQAAANGLISFVDEQAPSYPNRVYRLAAP